ncbi:MAG: PAS domain S-box protein [Gemmataceae bacterium]
MAPLPAARVPSPGTRPRAARPAPRAVRALGAAVAVVTLLCHPLLYSSAPVALWTPALGVALALVAWVGPRLGALLLAGCGAALLLRHAALPGAPLGWVGLEAGLLVAEPVVGWWLYHRMAWGARRLGGPRSATLFVCFVPGVVAACAAAARLAASLALLPPAGEALGLTFARLWLDQALGLVIVAPPLLVLFTPPLTRAGWAIPEPTGWRPGDQEATAVAASPEGPGPADWAEIAVLALAASAMCLLLGWMHQRRELLGWQLWGLQLLFIIWASLRQGLRGGTLVAAASGSVPLLARQLWPSADESAVFLALLRGHLFAQATTALLVAAASSWVRAHETGYRQLVSHIPVVVYSARLGPSPELAEVTLVSAASARLLNCPPDQLLGDYSRWLTCVHPDDREVLMAAIDQLTRQDQPVTCEYRLVPELTSSRRGQEPANPRQVRWVRDTLAPRRDADGRLLGWEGVVNEVTEQRALSDDLRRTTNMFNALVGNLPAGVFFVQGPHGQPIVVNPRARQLLGQREDASAGLEHLSQVYRLFRADGTLYPADQLPVYLALRHGQTTMRDDIVVHRPDGRRVPLVTWAAPVQLGGRGGPDAAVWVFEDLTAVHQAEAARKDSESRLRATIEAMAEGLLVLDGAGKVAGSNPAATAFFGTPAERLRGRTVFELDWHYLREDGSPLPADDHPAAVARRAGRPVRNAVIGAYPAGAAGSPADGLMVRWVLASAMPMGSSGVVLTLSDISAHVQAREAIRLSEGRFRGLVEALPLMVVLTDREMNLTYINPATTATSGYHLDEIRDPAVWTSHAHADDLPALMGLFGGVWAGQSGRMELRYRARDGGEKTAVAMIQPRTQEGAVVGALALLLDVTRERQLERELQRSQRLELVGRLASGVAHDFNNLLGVVLNLADIARRHLPAEHPVHADLHRISEAGEQAVSLAGQLLAFSRQRTVEARPVALNRVVRRTLELLRATLPGTIRVEADLTAADPTVQGDDTQMQQVLMNLCLNARDAMPAGGLLGLTTVLDGGRVVLSVRDTGTGMTDAVRGRIFEPFFSTKESGNGLGLAIVQRIVECYQGTIEVESRPDEGARFVIRWPAAG